MNITLAKYATLDCAEYLQDQTTPFSSVYHHISFSSCNNKSWKIQIRKEYIQVKNTKETSKGIWAELSSPNGIAKRWSIAKRLFGDSSNGVVALMTRSRGGAGEQLEAQICGHQLQICMLHLYNHSRAQQGLYPICRSIVSSPSFFEMLRRIIIL